MWDVCVPYYNAFRILSATRQWAAGFSPIPQSLEFSEIRAVAHEYGFRDHMDEFVDLMLDADRTWRECWKEDYKARNPPKA